MSITDLDPTRPLRAVEAEPYLFDERSISRFRGVFGELLRASSRVDVAVGQVRLAGVDLTRVELGAHTRLRVLVGQVRAPSLTAEAEAVAGDPVRARRLEVLLELLGTGRLEIRTEPMGAWAPDFSVFHRGEPVAVLLGPHWFQEPFPTGGPAFGALHGSRAATLAAGRFSEVWQRAHAIGDLVRDVLDRARVRAGGGVGPTV